jgi:hypothetical protein
MVRGQIFRKQIKQKESQEAEMLFKDQSTQVILIEPANKVEDAETIPCLSKTARDNNTTFTNERTHCNSSLAGNRNQVGTVFSFKS